MARDSPTASAPKLAVFPKCFMDQLCVDRTMSVFQWIEMAATLNVDGLEFYSGFLDDDPAFLARVKNTLDQHDLQMPMLCCSPDFTEPDPERRAAEIRREQRMVEITAFFGGRYCRVLSGQRRPELSVEDGIERVAQCIERVIPHADRHHVTLTLENHYKDNYWTHPEFAQKQEIFFRLLARIPSPTLAVNFDPSNAILAGEDPLELLDAVKDRVVTMHASDRYLKFGTMADLKNEEASSVGYAARLAHGVIGKGLNDYDQIFRILRRANRVPEWISIEDGMNGLDELRESVAFLRAKIAEHFGEANP